MLHVQWVDLYFHAVWVGDYLRSLICDLNFCNFIWIREYILPPCVVKFFELLSFGGFFVATCSTLAPEQTAFRAFHSMTIRKRQHTLELQTLLPKQSRRLN